MRYFRIAVKFEFIWSIFSPMTLYKNIIMNLFESVGFNLHNYLKLLIHGNYNYKKAFRKLVTKLFFFLRGAGHIIE